MTPEQKQIVTDTWAKVGPQADKAAQLFYERLFETDPTTRPLFDTTDMARQRKKLLQVLSAAVDGLDRLHTLVPVVRQLGERHASYGVEDSHYESVGEALMWTLERGLGDDWSPEAANAWGETYGLLSGIMRSAANQAPESVA